MELIDLIPEFNLYEEYWKIYTKSDIIQPQYLSADSIVEKSIIGEGSEIYGEVHSSVIGAGVTIGKGSVVRDSIIMKGTQIGENVVIDKAIIAENCSIGDNVILVSKQTLFLLVAVRNDMLTKVTVALIFHCSQSFLQYLPAKYVDSH